MKFRNKNTPHLLRRMLIVCALVVIPALGMAQNRAAQPLLSALPYPSWEKYALVDSATKQAITGVVKNLFDGMSEGDTAKIRTQFFDTIDRMHTVQHFFPSRGDTTSVAQFGTVKEFLERVRTLKPQGIAFEERILRYDILRDGDFATVWCPYEVYVNTQFRHCGVDVFTMTKTAQGWKILHLSDTRRKDGCK